MDHVMIFIVGVIIGIVLMAIITAASNIQWGCRDENKKEDDLISREGLVEYLNLDNYGDTDAIKVKYIRAYLNKKEE